MEFLGYIVPKCQIFYKNYQFQSSQKPFGFGRVSQSGSGFFGFLFKSWVRVSVWKKQSRSGFCRVQPRPVTSLLETCLCIYFFDTDFLFVSRHIVTFVRHKSFLNFCKIYLQGQTFGSSVTNKFFAKSSSFISGQSTQLVKKRRKQIQFILTKFLYFLIFQIYHFHEKIREIDFT